MISSQPCQCGNCLSDGTQPDKVDQTDDQPRMSIGELELRRTEEGWQYLSEGVGLEPDIWCDAINVLGPFGGSGVNDLLDEVHSLREEIAQLKSQAEEQLDG
ncbi:hypothetical protein ACRCPS_31205 [Pseudomonas aeruginosa]